MERGGILEGGGHKGGRTLCVGGRKALDWKILSVRFNGSLAEGRLTRNGKKESLNINIKKKKKKK